MSTALKKNRVGLVEMYQTNLERRIQQSGWNPVCKDEELSREVESLLSKGAAQDTHSLLGLDPLSVMEASLQALPTKSGRTGLEKLAKAFEVLELAALNLYLCPWRKEYRVVKMFSGMFTHYVKPALTTEQAKELFGLLGYQPTGFGEEEELKLSSKPVHADTLLQLACAFFAARVECQLLLSNATPLASCVEWELQLVLERKRGHSLHVARESAKRKLECTPQSSEPDMTDIDLYTDDHEEPRDQEKADHITAPLSCSYTPPKDTSLSCQTSNSLRVKKSEESTDKAKTVCVSKLSCQISSVPCPSSTHDTRLSSESLKPFGNANKVISISDAQISVSRVEEHMCMCFKTYDLHACHGLQCSEIHNFGCPHFKSCQEQEHDLRQTHQPRIDVPSQTSQSWEQPYKHPYLKKHSCMSKPTSDFFYVCYVCYNIHDFQCDDLRKCHALKHDLQQTGRLQPPQGERGIPASPERHTCLSTEDTPYVVCHTCNQSHDCLCKELQKCGGLNHVVHYLVETNKEMQAALVKKPILLHQCCTSEKPDFVCLTCKFFHAASCEVEQCHKRHEVQNLKSVCSKCSQPNLSILCKYCCAQYCKKCWFESPINCKCGMPYDNSSPV